MCTRCCWWLAVTPGWRDRCARCAQHPSEHPKPAMSLEKISIHCPCISGFIPPRVIASVLFQSSDHRAGFWSPGFTGGLWEVLRPRRCPRFPPQFLFHFLLGCSVSPCHVKGGSNVELGESPRMCRRLSSTGDPSLCAFPGPSSPDPCSADRDVSPARVLLQFYSLFVGFTPIPCKTAFSILQ